WMENIQDWCISRQIWWGHRIPIWYCLDCKKEALASVEAPVKCSLCGSTNIKQEEDVLDTWFSSWLWPFATFRNKAELQYFYPTSTLVTAPEIIFFWVARMIMAGLEFQKAIPFKDVYIHGTVRDIEGKKMSKSLGNIIDPLEIINEYGADALRFSLISITAQGQDVYLSRERFEQGRNFANKIWNASRFILMNLDSAQIKTDLCAFFKKEDLSLTNRWILSRFYSTLKEVGKDLGHYQFNEAANLLYSFFWHEFCDWYLEIIKAEIKNPHNQVVMYKILEKFLRALHPFMPYITEELWQKLPHEGNSIMVQSWPHIQENMIDRKSEKLMAEVLEVITAIRNMRLELDIPPQADNVTARIFIPHKLKQGALEGFSGQIKNLARLRQLDILSEYKHSPGEFAMVVKEAHIVIPLSGVIDIEKHKEKLGFRINKAEIEIKAKEKMLGDRNFLKRAPEEIVEKEKEKLKNLKSETQKLKGVRDALK
ncbi:MAG: class I tRNA ligase family protein, partial [Candidatus Omnitrophica bacterium]|nr:class I tRNA ligase family protein [Candidatus Omnitrophota bacterium]